ncbi:uncharacterized protein CIMG_08374 [Coccidioides immitis RS]|uniref:Myb-like domain-containing protein n=1 Tax=Coccidioides immitis (strain RS) TaxID=246410 RepID=J3K5D2_COCIM|nr:uncharacterized protein CIMG_08374 [Coccidioides immitis RS]EAS29628.3 hypothetical protein CIMG_08374 [Coccidioides immitis RS]
MSLLTCQESRSYCHHIVKAGDELNFYQCFENLNCMLATIKSATEELEIMMEMQDPNEWPTYLSMCLPTVLLAPPTPSTIETLDNILEVLPHPTATESQVGVDQMQQETFWVRDRIPTCCMVEENQVLSEPKRMNGNQHEPITRVFKYWVDEENKALLEYGKLHKSKSVVWKGKSWTAEENKKLLELREAYPDKDWCDILEHFHIQSLSACKVHYEWIIKRR